MRRGIEGKKMLEEYIEIGAYIKMMYNLALVLNSKIPGDFNKTHILAKNAQKIYKEISKLKSDLEDSMPYGEISRLCEEKGINPIDIFYDSSSIYEPNRQQTQLIYDCFLKNILESEEG